MVSPGGAGRWGARGVFGDCGGAELGGEEGAGVFAGWVRGRAGSWERRGGGGEEQRGGGKSPLQGGTSLKSVK